MSIADQDRRLLRRAALHRALAIGDVLGAARAWDRLRVSGAAVTPEEAAAARSARGALGHAIREARWRREHDADRFGFPLAADAPPVPRIPFLRRWRRVAAVAALAALTLFALFLLGPAPGGSPALQTQATPAPLEITSGGRGRTSATFAPVVRAPQSQVREPDEAERPGQTGAPGSGTGIGAGTGAGAGTAPGLLPPLQPTDDRFVFVVLDDSTGLPLRDVCVSYGSACDPLRKTNARGLWWIDFPRSDKLAKRWRFDFVFTGYVPAWTEIDYVPGQNKGTVEIRLKKTA